MRNTQRTFKRTSAQQLHGRNHRRFTRIRVTPHGVSQPTFDTFCFYEPRLSKYLYFSKDERSRERGCTDTATTGPTDKQPSMTFPGGH